jgi:hypothetical protein
MIGVAVPPAERDAAREFFELCKTPWEFFQDSGDYEVVICTAEPVRSAGTRLVLIFNGANTRFYSDRGFAVSSRRGGGFLLHAGRPIPVYREVATFPASPTTLVQEEATREPVIHARRAGGVTEVRIGYNLFEETRFLLTTGQPAVNASTPTLDLHIALLRDLITRAGLPVAEIPPVPAGSAFIACLTHDIDHPILRNHFFDRTMFGFLYRATIGSLVDAGRGRKSLRNLGRNWAAVGRLPLVHLGLARDFWRGFDRYLEIEAGRRATYFVIPRRDDPGRTAAGRGLTQRACRYDLDELRPQLTRIIAAGSEVGLHGIDAWRDASAGRQERLRVAQATSASDVGVRMHWLYFDRNSPAVLDAAGFSYDSTVGYNETVGFRAGTAQAYRPPGATNLLELPLHAMDTALFFPAYLNLAENQAGRLLGGMMDDVARVGGALTINWHDRSIAPERLWGDFYVNLLGQLRNRGAWSPTAAQAVAWFRKRRAAVVESGRAETGVLKIRGRVERPDTLPGLRIRVHKPRPRTGDESLAGGAPAVFVDADLTDTTELSVSL